MPLWLYAFTPIAFLLIGGIIFIILNIRHANRMYKNYDGGDLFFVRDEIRVGHSVRRPVYGRLVEVEFICDQERMRPENSNKTLRELALEKLKD